MWRVTLASIAIVIIRGSYFRPPSHKASAGHGIGFGVLTPYSVFIRSHSHIRIIRIFVCLSKKIPIGLQAEMTEMMQA